MAIDFAKEGKTECSVNISNGHLEKLKKITKQYGMKGELHTIAFLLDVAEQSAGKGLSTGLKRYMPSEDMKHA